MSEIGKQLSVIMSIQSFLRQTRVQFSTSDPTAQLRLVLISELLKKNGNDIQLSKYLADRAPLYYRNVEDVINSLSDGFMLSTLVETLSKLPTSDRFQSSHFGEIVASVFLEDVLGYKRLYSKLSHNTSENQNAFKMDVVSYVPGSDPVEFIFSEVKSSPKSSSDGLPPNHDKSCFADVFNSLRDYSESDLKFDLTLIKDNLNVASEADRSNIKKALRPYSNQKVVGYIGMLIIDQSTLDPNETEILGTRKSNKNFSAELICVEEYKVVSLDMYELLNKIKESAE